KVRATRIDRSKSDNGDGYQDEQMARGRQKALGVSRTHRWDTANRLGVSIHDISGHGTLDHPLTEAPRPDGSYQVRSVTALYYCPRPVDFEWRGRSPETASDARRQFWTVVNALRV